MKWRLFAHIFSLRAVKSALDRKFLCERKTLQAIIILMNQDLNLDQPLKCSIFLALFIHVNFILIRMANFSENPCKVSVFLIILYGTVKITAEVS